MRICWWRSVGTGIQDCGRASQPSTLAHVWRNGTGSRIILALPIKRTNASSVGHGKAIRSGALMTSSNQSRAGS